MMTPSSGFSNSKSEVTGSEGGVLPRRVLVLAGGGAKGAYAFGCMLAFAKAKIRFEMVAGTSVGALNAILWCTNSMRSGIALWRSISFGSVYPVRFCDPRKNSRIVIAIFASAYVLCRLAWATACGTPAPARSLFRALLTFIISSPGMGIAWYAMQQEMMSHPIVWWMIPSALVFALCWGCLDGSSQGRWFLGIIYLGYLLAFEKLVEHSARQFIHSRWLIGLTVCFTLVLVTLCCCFGFLVLRFWLASDKSVLDSSPLRNSVSDVISSSKFEIPAIATTSREEDVFDPDSPAWYTLQLDENRLPMYGAQCYPQTFKKWRATYVDLSRLPAEDAIRCCVASAAIPFGIVPPVKIGNDNHVDGGVADNCPVYPFLNRGDIDEIFIVLLSPYRSEDDALQAAGASLGKWQERYREGEVAKFPLPRDVYFPDIPYRDCNKPPKVIPYRTPKPFPVCVPFYPSGSLGNFMSGTLNFAGSFARRSICRGYADARLRLQNLGYWS